MSIDRNLTNSLILPVLQKCDPIRLEKAILGLLDSSLTVTLTHQEEGRMYAIARNGDGVKYDVALTAAGATCTCSDFTYRQVVCKHLIGTCLAADHAARQSSHSPAVPTHHLQWRDGSTCCGATPTHVWRHWTAFMLEYPNCCQDCARIYRSGYNAHQALKANVAA